MSVVILRGDARSLPLPDESVDLIVTSPPYWNLRDYRDNGESMAGQIGSEETPRQWLEALLDCTREWVRVLKPEGSIFVDLGDKYSARADGSAGRSHREDGAGCMAPVRNSRGSAPAKSLLLLPERYRIACLDELGLIVRAKVVWSKPSPLPESAEDRVQVTHEDIVHLTRRPRYFAAVDEIRQPHTGGTHGRRRDGRMSPKERAAVAAGHRRGFFPEDRENPLGKLPGSVWEIASQPLIVPDRISHARCCGGVKHDGCEDGLDHFAAYPFALVRPIISGWSPPGICSRCGEGRRPVVDKPGLRGLDNNPHNRISGNRVPTIDGGARVWAERMAQPDRIIGYACACPEATAPTIPAVVLDPFGGTGSTALVADALGRTGITVDRSADYCRLATWRTTDPAERAKAMQVPKPPPVPDGQSSLFDLAGEAS